MEVSDPVDVAEPGQVDDDYEGKDDAGEFDMKTLFVGLDSAVAGPTQKYIESLQQQIDDQKQEIRQLKDDFQANKQQVHGQIATHVITSERLTVTSERLTVTSEELMQKEKLVQTLLKKLRKKQPPDMFSLDSPEFKLIEKRLRTRFNRNRAPRDISERRRVLRGQKDKLARDLVQYNDFRDNIRKLAMEVEIRKTVASEDDDYLEERDKDDAEALQLRIEMQEAQLMYEQKLAAVNKRRLNKRRRIEEEVVVPNDCVGCSVELPALDSKFCNHCGVPQPEQTQ